MIILHSYRCPNGGHLFKSRYRNRRYCSHSCQAKHANPACSLKARRKISDKVKKDWANNRARMMAGLNRRDLSKSVAAVKILWGKRSFRRKIITARKKAGYKCDPLTPIRAKIRIFARNSLRRCLRGNLRGCFDLLGYTREQLRLHIESGFKRGMSWANYGEWEIDHIRPIARFPIGTPLAVIHALSNLQPLWKPANRKKWAHVL